MTADRDAVLRAHLIRADGQEDLAFALWTPSVGSNRLTALLHTPVLPGPGERHVHGNVAFEPDFLHRALTTAMHAGCGLAFLHSHPFPGWQHMSDDDVHAERRMAGAVEGATGLPLIGLTIGNDGTWSARAWHRLGDRQYERAWCGLVRVVGDGLRLSFRKPSTSRPRDMLRHTVAVWSDHSHAAFGQIRVGIVGLGSVGSLVAETLARMGLTRFTVIDYDRVEPHNLDRLVNATSRDVGGLKVDVAERRIRAIATAGEVEVTCVPYSVVEHDGYRAALDCDVLFSCVDRPRARYVLDHLAFAHLIPVIDGGVQARFRDGELRGVDWQLQTVMPGGACLECLGTYDPGDVSTEAAGKLDDPSYLAGLPRDHHLKRNENVFPFAANLASLEALHLMAMIARPAGVSDFGVQRFRFVPGILEQRQRGTCHSGCDRSSLIASGDTHFSLHGADVAALASRDR